MTEPTAQPLTTQPDEGTAHSELTDTEWRQRLSPERYAVLRQKGTEPAWSGELLHVDDDGMFTCAGCGAALFTTDDKFDSGCGWPSFARAAAEGTIDEHDDTSHGMRRTEITCARCGGHLGHVFPDGPAPTGLRYCVNSLSIEFQPGAGPDKAAGTAQAEGPRDTAQAEGPESTADGPN